MYTLGIPKRDYRRATRVLDYESEPTIPYHANLQDDGFYLFTFPEAGDEDDFRAIVIKLRGEGVRVIGADAQLTEREIMKLVDLVPLKEESTGAFGATSEELADMYSLKQLQQFRDEVMMDMEQQAEPEGGPIADMYGGQLDGLDKAIAIKRGETKDVPYDVAIGRMTQDEYDKMMSTVKPDRASFEKSSKFDRMNETTEKAWNAIDVSRKAEKEISNKEWNERTSKKLDMLKKLNDAGKFKKDWDEETLQGWVDQNFSWEKISKKFKLNKMQEISDYDMLRSFQKDELLDDLGDIIAKYVKDPDDVDRELDRFDDGGFDSMSNMVTANLLRDPEYQAWAKKFYSIKENNDVRKVIRKIIREQNFDQRLAKAMGMSDDEFQDKVASRDVSGESMSNADIGALQKLVGNYSLEKILKTIAIIADRGGKNDEAFEIENFLKTFNKE